LLATRNSAASGWVSERIGGDHDLGKVERGQQRGEGGDLLGGAADLAWGQDRAGGMLHRRQQLRGVGVLQLARVGMGEVGQGGWDRDRG
jgi:hypothetical protein